MFIQVKEFIESTLSIVQPYIETDAADAVLHYVNHDSYEIAFEGLFLEIMQLEEVPPVDLNENKRIAMELQLHKESVSDIDFWNKFQLFLSNNKA